MRIIKYIFLLLLLIALALSVFILTQPSQFVVEEQQEVSATPTEVFLYIDDFSTWNDWFVSFPQKSTTKTTSYNTHIQWDTKEKGAIFKQNSFASDSVLYTIKENYFSGNSTFSFVKNDTQKTNVKWKIIGEISLKEKFLSFFYGGIENSLQSKMKTTLKTLNSRLNTTIFKHEIITNGFETKKGYYYISIADTTTFTEFDAKREIHLKQLNKIKNQHNLNATTSPFVLFESWNTTTNSTIFETCLAVENTNDSLAKVLNFKHFNDYLALKTTLKGNYLYRKEAWDNAFKAIEVSNYKENHNGHYIEVYKNSDDKIPANNVTEIYIPVYFPQPKVVNQVNNDSLTETIALPAVATDTIQ